MVNRIAQLTSRRVLVRMGSALLACWSANSSPLMAQGITYTLSPAATSISWDSSLGLKNHSLYGAQASVDFEQLVSLQGYYFTNDKVNSAVDKLGLSGDLANQLKNQRLGVRSMGANVLWKFWSGGIAPYLKTGGGVVELRPDSGRRSKQIAFNAGGGLRFGGNAPLFLDLFAEDMMLRVDRYALFNSSGATLPADPRANDIRHNLVVGAAIGVPLGLNTNDRERNATNRVQWGLSGASLTLEPFAGRLTFDNKSAAASGSRALRDQELAGLRAGVDLGRYVGVRGFYWKGTNKNFNRTESLQSWGGEMQFRLNSSPGLTPYLLAGAAQLDFNASDTTKTAQHSEDKLSLLLGGGLSLPLGERFALNAAARDYMYGQGNGTDNVSSPSDLRHNWMYTVGLRVSVAGHSGSDRAQQQAKREQELMARVRDDSVRMQGRMARVENDTIIMVNGKPTMVNGATLAAVRAANMKRDSVRMDSTRADSVRRAAQSARTITLPVPTVGELYVRYGTPQGMATQFPVLRADSARADSMRLVVDTNSRTDARNNGMSPAQIDSLVNAKVDARMAQLSRNSNPSVVVVPPTAGTNTVVQTPGVAAPAGNTVVVDNDRRTNVVGSTTRGGLMVYSGLTVNGGAQLSLGGRFDLGPITASHPAFHFAPEIAIGGGGGGRSTMIVANTQYLFGKFPLGTGRTIQPHVVGGLGLLNFSDRVGSRNGLQGVINLGYGVSIPIMANQRNRAAPVVTIEHQGIDLFQLNRVLVGLSWRLQ